MKTVFIDLDGTLWNHEDASSMTPPFQRVGNNCIVDSFGEKLCLYDNVRLFLGKLDTLGLAVCVLSWNRYSVAREALETLGILKYFDYLFIEDTPFKELVLEKALRIISHYFKTRFSPRDIIYIDDRDIHVNEVKKVIGNIRFIHMWHDVKDFIELSNFIQCLL